MNEVSPQGVAFIAAHEGVVLRAYKDAVGVITVGTGFTMRSRIFAQWFRAARGHDLRLGDTITRAENDMLLARLLNEEYGPPVTKLFGGLHQHQYDACLSVVYNCGPGTLKDRWAMALEVGQVAAAANLLRTTRITAGGRRLQGLVDRRADEARLLSSGNYGATVVPPSTKVEDIKAYQADLKALGYYKGAVDGLSGPATLDAVMNFQRAQKLTVDGIVGPATRAALGRARAAQVATKTSAAGGAIVAAGGTAIAAAGNTGINWPVIIIVAIVVAAVVGVGFWVWHNRGALAAKVGVKL